MPRLFPIACVPALVLCWMTVAAAAPLSLTINGATNYVVALSPNASPSERWAAEELVDHIKQISGAVLPIRTATADPPAKAVLIGDSAAVRALGVDVDAAELGTDGFLIRTIGDRLVIAGGRQRGTLYGVYTLLESLGVRWWYPEETFIPEIPTIRLDAMDVREVPALEYRDMMYGEVFTDEGRLWYARNKVNGMGWSATPEKLGGRYTFVGNLVHSYMGLLNESGVEITPEMLALNDQGRRRPTQPCLTHPEVLDAMVKGVIGRYRANPDAQFVVVGQNDNFGYCRCDDCQAIAEREQSQAGPVIVFANQVAEAVEKEIPGAHICTAAYQWSRKPPAHVKPRENVHITLCTIECDFGHPFSAGTTEVNRAFRDDIVGWGRIASKVFIWDYTTNFRHLLMPHPNLDVPTENVRFFADHGTAGVFEQGAHTAFAAEFSQLRMWVLARSLWNPQADGAKLIEEFLTGYYGPAADAIREYIDIIHGPVRRHQDMVVRCYMNHNAPYVAPELIARSEQALRRAERAAAGDETYTRRVRHARMPIWYMLLTSGPQSPTWRAVEAKVGPMTFGDIADSFAEVVDTWNMNTIAEGSSIEPWMGWLADYKALTADGSVPIPPELEGVDPATYTLVQAGQLDQVPGWLVPAAGAADGWAMKCETNAWLIRLVFGEHNHFTPGTRYRLFIRARGDLQPGATGEVLATGVQSRPALRLSVDAEDIGDAWAVYEVGEFVPRDGEYFWFAVQNTDALKAAYLDCVWLLKTP